MKHSQASGSRVLVSCRCEMTKPKLDRLADQPACEYVTKIVNPQVMLGSRQEVRTTAPTGNQQDGGPTVLFLHRHRLMDSYTTLPGR